MRVEPAPPRRRRRWWWGVPRMTVKVLVISVLFLLVAVPAAGATAFWALFNLDLPGTIPEEGNVRPESRPTLVFDAEGTPSVVLVSQYRPPYERAVIEIPAGMRDVDGEATDAVAQRELIEEAGLMASRLDLLTEILPSPGMTDSVTTLYLATGCTPVPHDRHGPEEAHMELLHVPLVDAIGMIDRGEIADAKSVVALLLTERRLRAGDHPT